jgi:hypothetical protein
MRTQTSSVGDWGEDGLAADRDGLKRLGSIARKSPKAKLIGPQFVRDEGGVVKAMRVRLSRTRVRLDDLLAEAGQRRFEIGQKCHHWQRKAAHAQCDALLDGRARVGAGIRQRTGTAKNQFDHRRIAASLLGRTAHDVEQRHGVGLGTDRGEESVAEAAGAAGGRFRVAADDDRHRFLASDCS